MDIQETHRLLVMAAQYDARLLPRSGQDQAAKAMAWNAALDVRMGYDWAVHAVAEMFAQGQETITPGMLNARLLAGLRDDGLPGRGPGSPAIPGSAKAEALHQESPALPPAGKPVPPTDSYKQAKAALGGSVAHPALDVACPWCGAAQGAPCTVGGNRMRRSVAHPSRLSQVSRR